jgi:hypothetical protein
MADPYAGLGTVVSGGDPYAGLGTVVSGRKAPAAPTKGRGSQADPFRVGTRFKIGSPEYKREVAKVPTGAFYEDPQGNLRQKENASGGNPIRKRQVERVGKAEREATGSLANLNRGLLIGDEGSALMGTLGNVLAGKVRPTTDNPLSVFNGLANSYGNELGKQRAYEDDFDKRRPWAGAVAQTTGMVPTLFVPGGAPAQATTRTGAVINTAGNAALQAGVAGVADRGTWRERTGQGAVNAAIGGVGGAIVGNALAPRAPKPASAATPQTILRDAGVSLTPGQRMGGIAKNTEDLAMRAPILGPAIAGARNRGVESLNRSVALQAVAPIGKGIPKSVKPGYDTVRYVDDALSNAYDDAFDMVSGVRLDTQLRDDLAQIATRRVDLPESMGGTFERIINDRLQRLAKPDLTGRDIKHISSEMGNLAAEYRAKGENTMADMLGDVRQSLGGLVARNSPEAGALIAKADEGWGIYKMLNSAAGKADARGGVYTPGQLTTAVRSGARRQGVNMAGKGEGRLQDLSSAAQQVMPDGFGNPGTANALGVGALGVGVITEPTTAITAATGLGAAATPYFLMGRKILEELPINASADDLARAQQELARLASRDPKIIGLQRELASRVARTAGATAAQSNQPASAATATQ